MNKTEELGINVWISGLHLECAEHNYHLTCVNTVSYLYICILIIPEFFPA